jgi:type IV pilus assembly protein PilF
MPVTRPTLPMLPASSPTAASGRLSAALLGAAGLLLAACAHVPTSQERQLAEMSFDQGVLAVNANRAQEAMKDFLDAVEKNPELPEPHNALGLLYHWSYQRLPEAKAEFEKALALKPDYAEASNNLGTLLADMNDLPGARKAYERALAEPLYKTPFVAQTNLAWILHLQGQDEAAEQMIRAALAAEPNYCVGHRQLARLNDAEHKAAEADAAWERFAALCPNEPEALFHAGALLARRDRPADAARTLQKCIEKAGAKAIAKDCRAALAALPPLPPEAVVPDPRTGDEGRSDAGRSVDGARDLDGRH